MSPLNFETVSVADLVARGVVRDSDALRPVALVVDDEHIIADTLVAILRAQGFSPFAAYDGETALEMARVILPEILISDVVMPGMNGVELAVELTRELPDCRVLLFSGTAATAAVLKTAHAAGHDFTMLAKPIHPTDLLAHISQWASRRSSLT
jgi:DNA-binding response OmpR family regulator